MCEVNMMIRNKLKLYDLPVTIAYVNYFFKLSLVMGGGGSRSLEKYFKYKLA